MRASIPLAMVFLLALQGPLSSGNDPKQVQWAPTLPPGTTLRLDPAAQPAPRRDLGAYAIRTTPTLTGEARLTVSRSGEPLFALQAAAFQVAPQRPADLTGDGQPNLVIFAWSGAAHFGWELFVVQLSDPFRVIRVPGSHAENVTLADTTGDGRLEVQTHDWTLSGWRASSADSSAPPVVLRYRDGAYRPVWDRRPIPTAHELARMAEGLQRHPAWRTSQPPLILQRFTLGLIYAGHPLRARHLLRASWPASVPGLLTYELDLLDQLASSPYRPRTW